MSWPGPRFSIRQASLALPVSEPSPPHPPPHPRYNLHHTSYYYLAMIYSINLHKNRSGHYVATQLVANNNRWMQTDVWHVDWITWQFTLFCCFPSFLPPSLQRRLDRLIEGKRPDKMKNLGKEELELPALNEDFLDALKTCSNIIDGRVWIRCIFNNIMSLMNRHTCTP